MLLQVAQFATTDGNCSLDRFWSTGCRYLSVDDTIERILEITCMRSHGAWLQELKARIGCHDEGVVTSCGVASVLLAILSD